MNLSSQVTQEAKIGRIWVPDQARKKTVQGAISVGKNLGMVVCAYHPRFSRKHKI
jgi:hypothetical protein